MWFSPWRRILRGRSGDAKPSIFDKIGKFFGIPGEWIKWGLVGVIVLMLAPVLIRLIRSIREAMGGEKE